MLNLMKQYNELVNRYEKAEKYFSRGDITDSEKLTQVNNLKLLISNMDGLIKDIKKLDYTMTDEEIICGFRQIKFLGGSENG